MEEPIKVYVDVYVKFNTEGRMIPIALLWEDGRKYKIDKVLDVKPAPAMRAGGHGDRYTIRVIGKESYLFFEHSAAYNAAEPGRWFVERRTP